MRTPVGYKCPRCAGEGAEAKGRSRKGLAVLGGALLVAVAAALTVSRPSPTKPSDPVAPQASTGEAPATRQAMLGEEARDGQLVFVVDDVACTAVPVPAEVPKLCTLRFRVRNDSSSPATLLGRFQYLVDAESRTYGADDARTRAVPDNGARSLSEMNINPEVVIPLVFVYELPATVDPTEAQFKGTGRSRFGVNVRLQRRA